MRDLADIATMKIRRTLERAERNTTSVVQARSLLEGEEFIEVHLHLPAPSSGAPGFGIDEVREGTHVTSPRRS